MYIFKSGKIKLKYSCNSEFHAKAIIRHIISFLSKNKQEKYLLCLEEKYKNTNTYKTKVHCFFFTCFNRTCLTVCIY